VKCVIKFSFEGGRLSINVGGQSLITEYDITTWTFSIK